MQSRAVYFQPWIHTECFKTMYLALFPEICCSADLHWYAGSGMMKWGPVRGSPGYRRGGWRIKSRQENWAGRRRGRMKVVNFLKAEGTRRLEEMSVSFSIRLTVGCTGSWWIRMQVSGLSHSFGLPTGGQFALDSPELYSSMDLGCLVYSGSLLPSARTMTHSDRLGIQ